MREIDLLRIIAAFSVVIFHYSFRGHAADELTIFSYPPLVQYAKYGYLGVQLFFMISGFVILMTAIGSDLRNYVISRIVRLYPAYWIACTITSLITILIGEPRFYVTLIQYAVNMTMLNGLVDVPSIDGAYWSLLVEIKFYFLVGCLMGFGLIHKVELFLMAWLIATFFSEELLSSSFRAVLATEYSVFFIAGAYFYLIWKRGISGVKISAIILCWIIAMQKSLGELPYFIKHYRVDMSEFVVSIIISLFFILMLIISARKIPSFVQFNWTIIGAITYPLYLLHQNIGYMIFNAYFDRINPHMLFWGTLFMAIGTSFLVHVLIERKVSNALRSFMLGSIKRI